MQQVIQNSQGTTFQERSSEVHKKEGVGRKENKQKLTTRPMTRKNGHLVPTSPSSTHTNPGKNPISPLVSNDTRSCLPAGISFIISPQTRSLVNTIVRTTITPPANSEFTYNQWSCQSRGKVSNPMMTDETSGRREKLHILPLEENLKNRLNT